MSVKNSMQDLKRFFHSRKKIIRDNINLSITIEELKDFLKINHSRSDKLLLDILKHCHFLIEKHLKGFNSPTTIEETFQKTKEVSRDLKLILSLEYKNPIDIKTTFFIMKDNKLLEAEVINTIKDNNIIIMGNNINDVKFITVEYISNTLAIFDHIKWIILKAASLMYNNDSVENVTSFVRDSCSEHITHYNKY